MLHYLGLMEKFLTVVFLLKIWFMDGEWNVIFLVGHQHNLGGLQRNLILGETQENIQVYGASLELALNSPSKYRCFLLLITVLIQAKLITLDQTGKEYSQKV